MKLTLFVSLAFCITAECIAMHSLQPITNDDLALIISVTERRSPHYLKLTGILQDGTQINYCETLSGENAGCATVQTTSIDFKLIKDESSADYWGKVLIKKLGNK